jgi:hypothetical protein
MFAGAGRNGQWLHAGGKAPQNTCSVTRNISLDKSIAFALQESIDFLPETTEIGWVSLEESGRLCLLLGQGSR